MDYKVGETLACALSDGMKWLFKFIESKEDNLCWQ